MTLRELLRECDYATPLVLYGVDADAAESLRRGRRPESGVLPLYRGAIGYAILDDALEEYIDRRVLRFTAGFARGVPELVVYQRLIQTREEVISQDGCSDVSGEPGEAAAV